MYFDSIMSMFAKGACSILFLWGLSGVTFANPEFAEAGATGVAACASCHDDGRTSESAALPRKAEESSALLCDAPSSVKTDFYNDAFPILGSCSSAACHGGATGAGDLKLSLFGGEPKADFKAIKYGGRGRLINIDEPESSLLLKKVSGELRHKGGASAKPDSSQYAVLRDWIKSGCNFRAEGRAEIKGLNLTPRFKASAARAESVGSINLRVGEEFDIDVSALFSDSTQKVVKARAKIDGKSLEKNGDSSFRAVKAGQSVIRFSFARKFATLVADVSPNGFDVADFESRKAKSEAPANPLDSPYLRKLELLGLEPAPDCSDEVFIRRLYLDATGLLPPASLSARFIKSQDADKRAKLVSAVLDSQEFTDFLSMKLGDLLRIKSEFPSNLWPNAVQAYNSWIRHAVAEKMPFDIFARELLDCTGTNFRDPAVNFYRAVNEKNPLNYADAAAIVFMGARMNCIKCHAHPFEAWTSDDARSMAAFFSQIKFKGSKEWKEEILTLDSSSVLKNPQDGSVVAPRTLDGDEPPVPLGGDPRAVFVNWLVSRDNPWFACAAVNRFWAWVFGSGIINPADDIRPNNPPSNAELLKTLEDEFKKDFDVRRIFGLIFTSKAYSRACAAPLDEERAAEELKFFARRAPVRLDAESLYDILNVSLGTPSDFKSIVPEPYSFWPKDFLSINLSDGSVGNAFLSLFGKPARNSSYLNDRSNALTMPQVMRLSTFKASDSPVLKKLSDKKASDAEKIKRLYLTFLCRYPTDSEYEKIQTFLTDGGKLSDVAWAIINTKEFVFKM